MIFCVKLTFKKFPSIVIQQLILIAERYEALIQQEGNVIALYLKEPTQQNLEDFAHTLSQDLSHSLYLDHIEAQFVEAIAQGQTVETQANLTTPCPRCTTLAQAYEIGQPCSLCHTLSSPENIHLKVYEKEFWYRDHHEYFFEKIGSLMNNGAVLQTDQSIYTTLTKKSFNSVHDRTIICQDLHTVCDFFHVNSHELQALASVEKPSLNLPVREKFLFTVGIPVNALWVRLPNNLIEIAILQVLNGLKRPFCLVSCDPMVSQVKLLSDTPSYQSPKIAFAKEKIFFEASSQTHGASPSFVIDLSKNSKSHITLDDGKTANAIRTFEFSYTSFSEIFQDIIAMDHIGETLIKNFQGHFPEKYEALTALTWEIKEGSLADFVSILQPLLSENETLSLYEQASNYKGTSGQRIDFRWLDTGALTPLWTVRTLISYLVAGASGTSLSYAFFESLAEYLEQTIDTLHKVHPFKTVVLRGTMFEEKILFQKLYQGLSKNYDMIIS